MISEITNEKINEVSGMLKTHIPNWTDVVASRMSSHKDWKKLSAGYCKKSTVYNISSGIVKSQFRRRIFIECAAALLIDAVQKIDNTLSNKLPHE